MSRTRPDRPAAPGPTATLTVLGSGTGLPDGERSSAAHHLSLDGAEVLMDCGPGTLHGFARHGVEWRDLTHVLVTHYHADHVGDLASLLALMAFAAPEGRGPLELVGPLGFGDFMRRLAAARGRRLLEPGFELRVVELGPVESSSIGDGTEVRAHSTPHTAESLAYRLDGPWGSLGYTGDTGPSDSVGRFMTNCDALIAECSQPDPAENVSHLSPRSLAELAKIARPGILVITHVYPELGAERAAERTAEAYEGKVLAAYDGLRIRIGRGGPAEVADGGAGAR